jgi:hypothetical protein
MKASDTMNRDKFAPLIWRDKLTMHLCIIFLSRLYLSPDASKPDISKITPPHLRARGKAVVEPEALRSLGDYHYAKIFTIKLQNCTWI